MPRPAASPDALRIALLVYRGNPHCGGQGVYTRELARELDALGHVVEVFSGQPYPAIDHARDGVRLTKVSSLDLYRRDNPFRVPWPWEFRDAVDIAEFGIMCGAGFPEPYTFSLRVRRALAARRHEFDVVHDNQCLGSGLLTMMRDDGWPVLATLHHPITVDRDLELEHATNPWKRFAVKRWYSFLEMQARVARHIPRIVTVSESSRRDIVTQMSVDPGRLHVVPVGVDPTVFGPKPEVERVPGRLMTTASADMPMKGLAPLLEALAKVRTEREDAHLVVIGRARTNGKIPRLIQRLGLGDAVEFVSGVATERIVELYAHAEVAVVPSLYEGFSLPAAEAMTCGVPVVATTGGAIPEVVGRDGETGLLVPPDDPSALAGALLTVLDDPDLRARLGAAGRERALGRFTWRATAEATADHYRALLEEHHASC